MSATPVLVDLAAASAWSGLAPGTLRRRIHEGSLTRHGTKGRALVDLRELPPADAPEAAGALKLAAAHRAAKHRRTPAT